MNLGESIPIAFKKFKGYSIRGTPIPISDPNYIDLQNLMYDLANDAQMDLCHVSKIAYIMKITQNPVINLLGAQGFDLIQHLPGDSKTYTAQGAKSFHFSIDRPCTLTFEQSTDNSVWTFLNGFYDAAGVNTAFSGTIPVTGNTSFTTRKGLLTLDVATNYVRVTLSSNYPFNSRNRALFSYAYAVSADVPTYEPYIPYDLPAKYMEFYKMVRSYDTRQLEENSDFKGPYKTSATTSTIYINWFLTGEFDIHIWVYPEPIDKDTDPSYEFEIGLDAHSLIPYYQAGYATKDQNIGIQLINQYYELKKGLSTPDDTQTGMIASVQQGAW